MLTRIVVRIQQLKIQPISVYWVCFPSKCYVLYAKLKYTITITRPFYQVLIMPSQREVANRFAKLLKRTSVKMQKVVSRPMPKFPPPADSEKIPHPLRTYDIRYTDGPDHDAFCSELHLNEDHLNNIELIVKYRQITFATLSAVAHDDSREGKPFIS